MARPSSPTATVPADSGNAGQTPPETEGGEPPAKGKSRKRARVGDDIASPAASRPSGGSGGTQGRRPKACYECKRLKVKCEVFPGDPKCRYCLRRSAPCIFSRTILSQYDKDGFQDEHLDGSRNAQLEAMRGEIRQMKASLDAVLDRYSAANIDHAVGRTPYDIESQSPLAVEAPTKTTTRSPLAVSSTRQDNTLMAMTRENSEDPPQYSDLNGPVTLEEPMESLYEVTRLRNIRSNKRARHSVATPNISDDFVSRGVISESEAEELYRIFQNTLGQYLWVGLEHVHSSFTSIRRSSELLAATILTVTALHKLSSSAIFDTCYKEFLSLISSSMFSRYHSIDDVRGLCIAAFWLSDVSWKLSGHAIRIATELNIHQSFSKALQGDKEHFLRARLWYMLYLCDRHFSIAYGRPPMVSDSIQIREHELFLASPLAGVLDARILSQVSLMQILTRVYDRFSERRLPDVNYVRNVGGNGSQISYPLGHSSTAKNDEVGSVMLSEADLEGLGSFNLEIDQWRMRWYMRQPPSPYIGEFPRRGVVLYSYIAKLQINSLAVRGWSSASGKLSTERKEFANMAVSAAISILSLFLDEEDMRKSLVGTPLYVHTMVAFASVFLMKAATRWDRLMGLNIDFGFVSQLLERMVCALKAAITSERHMIQHIARGLEGMLARVKMARNMDAGTPRGGLTDALMMENASLCHDGSTIVVEDPLLSQAASGSPAPEPTMMEDTAWSAHETYAAPELRAGWEDPFVPMDGESGVFNDQLMFQAFGTGANDVYNLLSAQFPY